MWQSFFLKNYRRKKDATPLVVHMPLIPADIFTICPTHIFIKSLCCAVFFYILFMTYGPILFW